MAKNEQDPPWVPTAFGRLVNRQRTQHLRASQKTLGAALGYSHAYISQIERGRLPDMDGPDFIERWARALDVTPEELITEGELWRYNVVPPGPSDLSPEDRALLAAVNHLPPQTRQNIARGLREMFPSRSTLRAEQKAFLRQAFREEAPEISEEILEGLLSLAAQLHAAEASTPIDRPVPPMLLLDQSPAEAEDTQDS